MAEPKPPPRVRLEPQSDGTYLAEYQWHRYRFLLTDGRTVDVWAIRDDSDLRGAVLTATKSDGLAGAATLPEEAADAP